MPFKLHTHTHTHTHWLRFSLFCSYPSIFGFCPHFTSFLHSISLSIRRVFFVFFLLFSTCTVLHTNTLLAWNSTHWWAVLRYESPLHPAASVATLVSHTVWSTHSYRPSSPCNPLYGHLWALTPLTPLHQTVRSRIKLPSCHVKCCYSANISFFG